MIKINSSKPCHESPSLEQRFSQALETRMESLQVDARFLETKDVNVLSQIISKVIFLAAKRQNIDYVNLMPSMVASYIELKATKEKNER